jgi:hypothetical protein
MGASGALIAYAMIVLLVLWSLAATYLAGGYVCPRCGARSADRHSGECPWRR